MSAETYPIQVLLMTFSGLVERHQADVIAYLDEENRILKGGTKSRRCGVTMISVVAWLQRRSSWGGEH